jgi:hypothetical protein
MAFIRNLIGVVEEICDQPHEFAATVNAFLAEDRNATLLTLNRHSTGYVSAGEKRRHSGRFLQEPKKPMPEAAEVLNSHHPRRQWRRP